MVDCRVLSNDFNAYVCHDVVAVHKNHMLSHMTSYLS